MPDTNAGTSYRDAGVDRAAAGQAKEKILDLVQSTLTSGVVRNPGGFGGLYRVPRDFGDGVLVASADGVGTKLKIAIMAGRHDTVGHDLVNHCVNDILVEGAHPLFFLDYIGLGQLVPTVVEEIIAGMVAGCRENGCALIGGETAQMPDFYAPGDYDLAGFIVGLTHEDDRPGKHRVRAGDALLGLAANGFHTNGYSLIRKILFDQAKLSIDSTYPGTQLTVAEELLRVHRSYLGTVLPLVRHGQVHALAHITGGGITENLERVLPEGLRAVVETSSWTAPPEFTALGELGGVQRDEMFATFNMGIGLIVAVDADAATNVASTLRKGGETVFAIGHIEPGPTGVVIV
jgi:phosphoribosylformylglycinamidine cyclo-ligase